MSVQRKHFLFFPSIIPLVVVCVFLVTGSVIGGEQQPFSVTSAATAAGEASLAASTLSSSTSAGTSTSVSGNIAFASFASTSAGNPGTNPPAATPGDNADPGLPLVPDADDGYQITDNMSISGHVTDPWGRGIPGIIVHAEPLTGAEPLPTLFVTDANGNYNIDMTGPGLFKIHFSSGLNPGYLAALGMRPWAEEWYNNQPSEETAEVVPSGASGVDAVLSPTGILHGHLNFPQPDNPISVTVVAFRADRQEEAGVSYAHSMPGPPDEFYFASIPPGDYKLLVIPSADDSRSIDNSGSAGGAISPFWYQGAGSWETAATVSITAGQTTDLQVDFPPADSGSVFGALFVNQDFYSPSSVISLVDAGDENKVVSVDNTLPAYPYQGRGNYFQFDNVASGDYKLKCTLPDGHVLWYTVDPSGGSEDFATASTVSVTKDKRAVGFINFSVSDIKATVAGHVLRSDGSNVTYQSVYPKKITTARESLQLPLLTDSRGEFSGALSPGTYKFCTEDWDKHDEYCSGAVTLGWHESVSGITITMPLDTVSPAIVEGRVLKPDGTAVPWTEVHVLSLDTGIDYTTSWIYPPGDFSFEVPAGTYSIFARNQGIDYPYNDGKPVRLKNGELLNPANIMVPQNFDTPGQVSGHVYGANVKSVPGAIVTGKPLGTMEGNMPVQTVADASGNYTLNLKPGWWQACVADGFGGEACSGNFEVTWNDNQAGHDIRTGSVIESGGNPSAAPSGSSAAAGPAARESSAASAAPPPPAADTGNGSGGSAGSGSTTSTTTGTGTNVGAGSTGSTTSSGTSSTSSATLPPECHTEAASSYLQTGNRLQDYARTAPK